jgi:hypothetical protein
VEVPRDATHGHFLAASAPGAGLDFIRLGGLDAARVLELRLVKDQVIRGRIVDTQGKPVAGVKVGVTNIGAFDASSVDSFLAAWTNRMISWQWPGGDKTLWQESGVITAATTDADGRFDLAGTGAERVVSLHVSGAGIADAGLRVVNRQGFNPTTYNEATRKQSPIIVSGPDQPVPVLYGPAPVFVVDPGKVIHGVVQEAGTGKLWQGVDVHCQGLSAKTDAAGHYEILGLGKTSSYHL